MPQNPISSHVITSDLSAVALAKAETEESDRASKDSSTVLRSARNDNKRKSGWTPARRAAQRAAIRKWAPWKRSTGPRTAVGKAISSRNAAKPEKPASPDMLLKRALKNHSLFLREINAFARLRKFSRQYELLARHLRRREKQLAQAANTITAQLEYALFHAKLCKNLDFSQPFRQIVNAHDNE